ncbi:NRAMP family divalent metal transporter [Silvimonas amylolytica]|uniref:Iron transporter n=1 Tax=Silvimonas amylolytica TaxID=449663 RepID=A0ABQ2PRB7_9NEIS|nr:divalent metal cation transporter [Silvimonas amylolytica]GGP28175.1 iron transporter [Silvimonas amylolytica]
MSDSTSTGGVASVSTALPASTRSGKRWWQQLGPGLITGAADDDPSGIATYSQAGAAWRFDTLWALLVAFPLMYAVQTICARIGRTTGHGLAGNLHRHYSHWLFYVMMLPMCVANIINIGADLSAMGDALALLSGIKSPRLFMILFGVGCTIATVWVPYRRYESVLKWLTLVLFAYVAVLFFSHVPWVEVTKALVWPTLHWNGKYLTTIVAMLGTTISPYLFFWQASLEVEDLRRFPDRRPLLQAPDQAPAAWSRIHNDTLAGMIFSGLIAACIVVSTAATLNAHGITEINTTAQAAQALRPVAGAAAFALFAVGIIGTGLLGVPVLAASAAYAVAGTLHWRGSLDENAGYAPRFYMVLAAAVLIGLALDLIHMDPMKALFYSAVVNGVVAVPIMVMLMQLAANRKIMGDFVVKGPVRVMGWLATLLMLLAVVAMLVW